MSYTNMNEYKRDWALVDRNDYDARLLRWIQSGKGAMPTLTDQDVIDQNEAEGLHDWDCQCGVHSWNDPTSEDYDPHVTKYCYDERHGTPCPQPCTACNEECNN